MKISSNSYQGSAAECFLIYMFVCFVGINTAAFMDHQVISAVFVSEYEDEPKLQEQLKAAEETLKYKKTQVQELQEELQVGPPTYSQCEELVPGY